MGVTSLLRCFVLVVVSMFLGRFVRENPMLFGMEAASVAVINTTSKSSAESSEFPSIITSHPVLDAVLKHHETDITGDDYEAYRNHCLRVMNFAVYYHGIEQEHCQPPPSNGRKSPTELTEQQLNVVALAVAYHDIALWTDGALAYLDPSVAVLEREIPAKDGKRGKKLESQMWASSLPSFTLSDLATAREIILQHHKFTPWEPPSVVEGKAPRVPLVDAALVNAVRRGDWADATLGIVKSGMSPMYLEAVYDAIPEASFHRMLLGMGARLSPNSLIGQLDVLKILKW